MHATTHQKEGSQQKQILCDHAATSNQFINQKMQD